MADNGGIPATVPAGTATVAAIPPANPAAVASGSSATTAGSTPVAPLAPSHPPSYVAVEGGYASVGGPGFPPPVVAGAATVPPTSPAASAPPSSPMSASVSGERQQQPWTSGGASGNSSGNGSGRGGGGGGGTGGGSNGAVVGAGGAAQGGGTGAAGGGSSGGVGGVSGGSPNGNAGGSVSSASKSSLGKRSSSGQSKPQSAWMLFIQDRREQVKIDNPDIAVTQQQKIMSEIWKGMSDDDREAYRSRARDDQKRYKAEQADKPVVKKEDFYGNDEKGQSTELVCPIGRIGRIIKLDQDVQSVTQEAKALIGKAMELFTGLVAKESFSVSQSQNRRLLKLQDIMDIMHNQDQFYWIKDDFPLPTR